VHPDVPGSPRERLRTFLAANFLLSEEPFPYDDDHSLLASGVVDSTGVLELIEFLEAELDTPVEDHEATRTNLGSVSAILRFVATKRRRKEAS
jgi:acyl carrier protein